MVMGNSGSGAEEGCTMYVIRLRLTGLLLMYIYMKHVNSRLCILVTPSKYDEYHNLYERCIFLMENYFLTVFTHKGFAKN